MTTMQETLHIFKKDIRLLRMELGLLMVVATFFVVMAVRLDPQARGGALLPWDLLLNLLTVFLIVRVVHAEAIPGTMQFWTTRPYHWKSLLVAKSLFILLCINLPIFVARTLIVVFSGFSMMESLTGLVESQLSILVRISIPAAALAAVTASFTQFIFGSLIVLIVKSYFLTRAHWYNTERLVWGKNLAEVLTLFAFAILILYMQYRNRSTLRSRITGVVAVLVVSTIGMTTPVSFAMNIQTWLWKHSSDSETIQVSLKQNPTKLVSRKGSSDFPIILPMVLGGVQDGTAFVPDSMTVYMEAPGHQGTLQLAGRVSIPTATTDLRSWEGNVFIPAKFFNSERENAVTLRATVYMAKFGKPRTTSIPNDPNRWVNVPGGYKCFVGKSKNDCWFNSLLSPKLITGVIDGYNFLLSEPDAYTVLSIGESLNPLVRTPAFWLPDTITVWEPLGHVRRDIEVHNIHLSDFVEIVE